MSQVYVKQYPAPKIDEREILRYAGMRERTPEMDALLAKCLKQVDGKLSYRVCWAHFPIAFWPDEIDLGFVKTASKDLRVNLQGCAQIVLFAATVGVEMERLTARAAKISPAESCLMHAVGAERAESLCDLFNAEISAQYETRPRFSPGYGDLELALQRDIFRALDCGKNLGLTLREDLLMTPTKSVTAIIGVKGERL